MNEKKLNKITVNPKKAISPQGEQRKATGPQPMDSRVAGDEIRKSNKGDENAKNTISGSKE